MNKFDIKLPRAHKRLEIIFDEVATLATKNDIIADVGTDHGYLPIMLWKAKVGKKLIATDISEKSLKKAQILAQKHDAQIDCRVCDGLAGAKETTLAVMAGIGGNEIIKIIEQSNFHGKMILQPVPTAADLREYLVKNNFKIEKDYVFVDEGKFYFVIVVSGNGKTNYSNMEMQLGNIKSQKKSKDFYAYVENQIKKLSFLKNFDITELTDFSKQEIIQKQNYLNELIKIVEERKI